MKGLKEEIKLIYTAEVFMGSGMGVGLICKDAIVLIMPNGNEFTQFVVAVPSEYAKALAEVAVRRTNLSL